MERLNASQTHDRLQYPSLARAIADVLKRDTAVAPLRSTLDLPNEGTLLLMPASDNDIAMTKVVTMHPENAKHDLATIQGEMIVMDAGKVGS